MLNNLTRRKLLKSVSAGFVGVSGCLGGSDSGSRDSDNDGVPDSEDYAPRDALVQSRDDVIVKDAQVTLQDTPSETEAETPSGMSCSSADSQDVMNSIEIVGIILDYGCSYGAVDVGTISQVEIKNVGDFDLSFLSIAITFRNSEGVAIYTSKYVYTGSAPSPGNTVTIDYTEPTKCSVASKVVEAIENGRYEISNIEDWNC